MAVRTFGPLRMGWRFCPKDDELIHYLREKNAGKLSEIEEIRDVDICKFEPEDLPGKSLIKTDDLEWFFFSPYKRKYQRGCRKDRMTNTGYWKVTGKDRNIKSRSSKLIGKTRTLVFYEGRAPSCERTNWIAHEYQTIENGVDGKKCEEGAFVLYRVKKKLDGDANSNSNNVEWNDFTPPINMPVPDDTRVGDAEQFETPSNQGILASSDMPVERSAANETDGRLYPTVPGEGQCHISAGVDGYEAGATEVETQVQSSKNSNQPECSSPDYESLLSPLNQNMYTEMGHNLKSPLFSDNFGTVQPLVFDDNLFEFEQCVGSPTREVNFKVLSRGPRAFRRMQISTPRSNDTDSEVAASQFATRSTHAEGLGSGFINNFYIDAKHKVSSNEEYLTNRNNIASGNIIKSLAHLPAWRSRSKFRCLSIRRIPVMEKSHVQSTFKNRELCGDAEGHVVKAARIVGRENGAVAARVNGGLSTELEEELEKRLAALQLADKTQAEASHKLEGIRKQIPSMMTVQVEERCKGIRG